MRSCSCIEVACRTCPPRGSPSCSGSESCCGSTTNDSPIAGAARRCDCRGLLFPSLTSMGTRQCWHVTRMFRGWRSRAAARRLARVCLHLAAKEGDYPGAHVGAPFKAGSE